MALATRATGWATDTVGGNMDDRHQADASVRATSTERQAQGKTPMSACRAFYCLEQIATDYHAAGVDFNRQDINSI